MAVNQFLRFCYGMGANKVVQAVYAAAAWLGTGFPVSVGDKTAYSNQLNKVWSQSSFMSEMLGNFIVAQLTQDVLDDGDMTNKLSLFTQAIATLSNGPALTKATAATVDLGAAVGGVKSNNINLTGSVGISSFGNSASLAAPFYYVKAGAAVVLTHSANLVCPGAVNLSLNAGAVVVVEFTAASTWVVRVVSLNTGPSAAPQLRAKLKVTGASGATSQVYDPDGILGAVTRTGAGVYTIAHSGAGWPADAYMVFSLFDTQFKAASCMAGNNVALLTVHTYDASVATALDYDFVVEIKW